MAQWPGNHISSMQLFYALKQKYPNIPDRLVSHCMKKAGGDEKACQELLESPEFSPYRVRRPSNLPLDDRSREDAGAMSISAPTTPCSITRRVPQSSPRPQIMPTSFLQYNKGIAVLIQAQLQRKKNLELEMEKDKKMLEDMTKRRDELKFLLRTNTASFRVQELNEEISTLRQDCIKLYSELDSADDRSSEAMKPITVRTTELIANGGEGISLGTEAWRCELCTFHNHPLLNQCEFCMMPRITLGIKAA